MVKTIDRRSKLIQLDHPTRELESDSDDSDSESSTLKGSRTDYIPIRDSINFDMMEFTQDTTNQLKYPHLGHLIQSIEEYLNFGRRPGNRTPLESISDFSVSMWT